MIRRLERRYPRGNHASTLPWPSAWLLALALGAGIALPAASIAQPVDTQAAAGVADEAPAALAPFVARYTVSDNGRSLGDATLRLVPQGPRWRVDLTMNGSGLFRIAGINAEQSTLFEDRGETYRPLTQATVRRTVFTQRKSVGTYDWRSRLARWQGDVKEHRRAPVALIDGDMSGLLINLAVIRDAAPGRTLQYRYVDSGRVREHRYVVARELEPVTVGELKYNAMRVSRIEDAQGDETVIWVAKGVPTPIRMLQREGGKDTYDLRLTEYQGVQ
ncbi:DUF3108 domain-containing protein [Lysobacter sp. A3-1-A15]|uniref:DUF3108 domain-containing protein n=1 Tax=Novilysobacter viscosus TaxID=3098602 RepID=UPI002ED8B872